jgi:hypothetical protein
MSSRPTQEAGRHAAAPVEQGASLRALGPWGTSVDDGQRWRVPMPTASSGGMVVAAIYRERGGKGVKSHGEASLGWLMPLVRQPSLGRRAR